jgi:hypothetical protein
VLPPTTGVPHAAAVINADTLNALAHLCLKVFIESSLSQTRDQ